MVVRRGNASRFSDYGNEALGSAPLRADLQSPPTVGMSACGEAPRADAPATPATAAPM